MRTTPPPDAVPLPERSFGELRCRRYLFDRDWWDPPPPGADPLAAGRAGAHPAPVGPQGGSEPR